eukprot:scaffold15896_cov65-Phaeocystis_antarctica.AAC.6
MLAVSRQPQVLLSVAASSFPARPPQRGALRHLPCPTRRAPISALRPTSRLMAATHPCCARNSIGTPGPNGSSSPWDL